MSYQESLDNTIFSEDLAWEDNSFLSVERQGLNAIRICANRDGLVSLANHLLHLANSTERSIVYAPFPGDLEDGSLDLEIRRVMRDGRKNAE